MFLQHLSFLKCKLSRSYSCRFDSTCTALAVELLLSWSRQPDNSTYGSIVGNRCWHAQCAARANNGPAIRDAASGGTPVVRLRCSPVAALRPSRPGKHHIDRRKHSACSVHRLRVVDVIKAGVFMTTRESPERAVDGPTVYARGQRRDATGDASTGTRLPIWYTRKRSVLTDSLTL